MVRLEICIWNAVTMLLRLALSADRQTVVRSLSGGRTPTWDVGRETNSITLCATHSANEEVRHTS